MSYMCTVVDTETNGNDEIVVEFLSVIRGSVDGACNYDGRNSTLL